MNNFNSIFPNFTNQCVQLQQLLLPVAYVLLIAGTISTVLTGQRSGDAYMRSLVRLLVLVVILNFVVSWGNTVSSVVDSTVKNVLHVDPTQIYNQYQNALQMQKTPQSDSSWWQKVFSVTATIFESLISAFLWALGWIASAIVFYAYMIQKIILYFGYALAPIFVGFFAFGSLYDIAKRYFLNLVGVMIWPLGWGVAGLITQGLIDFMTDQSFLHTGGFQGISGYSLQNFMGAAFLGIWIIFSTIAAPVIISKSISFGSLAGSYLMSGAAAAGRSAVVTAATVGTSVASAGGGGAAVAGAIAGTGAGLESLVGTSTGVSGGSLIGSLTGSFVSVRSGGGGTQKNKSGKVENPTFKSDDLTGDKAVAEMLKKSKK
ncbi:MAG TPA: type IV secretion system protein [Verrucomicrobiae bacterium]|nr:type IV secretion system protein [Verrucomicrobiae bacterium]